MLNERQMNCNFGVGFINPHEEPDEDGKHSLVHMVLYENEPTEDDLFRLWDEIATEEEFGLMNIVEELEMVMLSDETIADIKRQAQEQDIEVEDYLGDNDDRQHIEYN